MGVASYPEYKDSGVTWLGRIPEHWDSVQLGRIVKSFKTGPFGSILHQSDYVSNGIPIVNPAHMIRGRIRPNPHRTISHQTFVHLHEYALAENDIVFSRRGDLGRCALVTASEHGYLLGTGSIRVRLLEGAIDPEYLLTSYQAQWVGDFLSSLSVGATMESLNTEILRQLPALIPPIEEQTQIARFLDWKNAQIKKFIRSKRRLIELLKEQKQNIINQAVTRGLDPDVKLRPSGTEWIGDIPEHWAVWRLKFLVRIKNGRDYRNVEADSGYPVMGSGGQFAYASAYMYEGESVLFGRKGTIDKPLYINGPFWTVDTMFYTEVSTRVVAKFLYYSALSFPFDFYSTKTALPSLTQRDLSNHPVALPPIEEQELIIEFIEEKSQLIDQATTSIEREIKLMREYRTRLISDVVTGQVDVRGIQVPEITEEELPELDEESTEQDDVIEDEGEKDDND